MFVLGVEYCFLWVYNVMLQLFEGMYMNTVVIFTCFVASVMPSLLINVFIYTRIAIVKRTVLIFVNLLNKSPSLLLLLCIPGCATNMMSDLKLQPLPETRK